MPPEDEAAVLLDKTERYLTESLLPFWLDRALDGESGGFLTYFDRLGLPTGETTKTLLMQLRMLHTMASAHRAGYGEGRCSALAQMGFSFIIDHYWDDEHDGWIWITDRNGVSLDNAKIGYGQCFALYALSEYHLATGDERGRRAADMTFAAISQHMVDTRNGGYYEIMQRDWRPERPGAYGGDRKSMDVHMHIMEALTTYYEMTGHATHRRRLREVMALIVETMLRPDSGTGYIQFSNDFVPLPAILFKVAWGRDAAPEDGVSRPLGYTSYGHNVEFAWLLLHAVDVLRLDRGTYAGVIRRIVDHCIAFGIDPKSGGVFVEGPDGAPPTVTEKQFWQQAEVLVGMLDAYLLFGEEAYWAAFRNVYDFVFAHFVATEGGGEWYERTDRRGHPIDHALGHAWKISYHTVRSMIQTIVRLKMVVAKGAPSMRQTS